MQRNDGGPSIRANPVVGAIAGILLIIVLGVGALYAYRSQTPAVQQFSYSTALSEIQDGRVRLVAIEDGRATLSLNDGSQQQVFTPDGGAMLAQTVADRNHADPAHPINLRFSNGRPADAPFVLSLLVGLLPLLVIVALVLLAVKAFAWRGPEPGRYDALSRLADLRDRAVITEEEFQREKRRILK